MNIMLKKKNTYQFSNTPTFEKFGGKLAAAIDGRD